MKEKHAIQNIKDSLEEKKRKAQAIVERQKLTTDKVIQENRSLERRAVE